MTLMSFFCRLINGRCAQEPHEPERESRPRALSTARSYAPYPPRRPRRATKIGIIGAGQIGGTLTRRLKELGHQVFVANSRGPESLSKLASETGATPVSVRDAVRGVDVVIVTIPEKNILSLPAGLFADTPDHVPIVDTGNYYPRQRDGRIEAIETGLPESKWVAQQLGRPMVKAFNNIYARHLLELGRPGRIALPVAGDDEDAKAIVLRLVDELGFDPVDAGGLDESWRQQPGTPVYAMDFDAEGVRRALSEAKKQRTPEVSSLSANGTSKGLEHHRR